MVKRWGVVGILLLVLALAGVTACNPFGGSGAETTMQTVKVSRGDLTTTVKGSGNVEASRDLRLTFGSAGRIETISVKEGESVTKDKVMAKLDTSALELARTQAQVALNQAQITLDQAKLTQQSAEFEMNVTRDKKDAAELALLKAQIDLRNAKYLRDKAKDVYRWPEVDKTQAEVDEARSLVEYATEGLSRATTPNDQATWADYLARAQANLAAKEAKLKAQLSGYDTEQVAIAEMHVTAAEKALAQAQKNVDRTDTEIALKEQQVKIAQNSVAQAQKNLELSQQSLNEAQKRINEATISAPFNGVVSDITADEGDTVSSASKIIRLVDPGSLEMRAEIDEIDIPEIKPGQEVDLTFDALPGVRLKGKVAAILPTPEVTGGVVLYIIKISFDGTQDPAVKVGMSASAEIITNRHQNVLLVPNRAIIEDSQGKTSVKVMLGEQVQERTVVTGISDGVQTEIISGLNEGETVVIETRARPAQGIL